MIASNLTVNGVGRFLNTIYGNIAGAAGRLDGFSSGGAASSCSWGNQTGTAIYVSGTPAGGGWAFRDNNPGSGQVSMVIDGTVYIKEGGVNVGDAVKSFSVSGKTVTYTTLWGNTGTFTTQDTTYTSQAAASGGTAVSLVTTGEKYTWNNKSNLTIGTTATTAAAGNHTHGLSLAADTGTSSISLAANTKYKLTAGGSTYIFTTPPDTDTNTHRPIQVNGTEVLGNNTTALNLKAGTNVSISNSSGTVTITSTDTNTWRPIGTGASDAAAGNHTHNYAGSSSAGGAATSLANFKATTTTNNAIDTPGSNAITYANGLTKANWNYQHTDGGYYCQWYNANWWHEIFGDYRTGQISVRGNNNGTKQNWRRVLDESNYTSIISLGSCSGLTKSQVTTALGYTPPTTDTKYTASTTSVGSASAGTAIAADDITGWTTNTPTAVTKKTVVTGGSTTAIPNISKKTVVTSASGATATYSAGVLTITNGSFSTGDSVTVGTAINAYTSLTTGDSVSVTAGTAASLSYTARSIPNISVTNKTVATGITAS